MGNQSSLEPKTNETFFEAFTRGFVQGLTNPETLSDEEYTKYIYILQLENNKYYIGKTTNPDVRIDNHFSNNGAAWTKKYKPIKVHKIIPGDDFDEDKYTLKYMSDYGIDNVRGGSYCEINLNTDKINQINHMIKSCKDLCFHCGSGNHFANKCPDKNIKKGCTRCGRSNHTKDCYAKTDIQGNQIPISYNCQYCNKAFDTQKGANYHELKYCKNKK